MSIAKPVPESVFSSTRRFLQFVVAINAQIQKAATEQELLCSICRVAVESGGYLFAWVGQPDLATDMVRPVCWSGNHDDYLEEIKRIHIRNGLGAKGPTGSAVRDGKYSYSNDIQNDPNMVLWKVEAEKRGFRSSIALPIRFEHELPLVFSMYAGETNWFDEEELDILLRVADQVQYAINSLRIKERERQSQQLLKRLSTAVNQSNASVVITDVAGNIEFVNPSFCRLTGYTYEEAMGQNPRILKTGITRDEEYLEMWKVLSSGKRWSGEFCNKKKDGTVYWESASIAPVLDELGVITGYIAVKENITEKKLAEKQLNETLLHLQIKSEALQHSNDELQKFAYVVSHDLQEPLRMVSSFLQLFEKKFHELVDEDGRKYIHFAIDGAARMKSLLNDLLQYSRATSKELEYQLIPADSVVQEVLQVFEEPLREIDAQVLAEPLPELLAGRTVLFQIFQNLIGNAIKYRSDRKLTIRIFAEETPDSWVIAVEDNGIGIDSRFYEKIFRIFQRLHLQEQYSGNGIGLAVVKKIIERYQGKIWVDSEPGKGTCFRFSIPKTNQLIQPDTTHPVS